MKKMIMSAIVLVLLLTSVGGCFVPWDRDGRGGRGGSYDRGGGHDGGGGHDRGGSHDRGGGQH